MTTRKLAQLRIKRKGRVSIPSELRVKLGIDEGALLEIEEQEGTIVPRCSPALKGGKVVGEDAYKQIIGELDRLRGGWRQRV
jgi:AbrB family looped-hinge helix DNA binding protein